MGSGCMVKANPTVDYGEELTTLREVYISAFSQARLNIIHKKLECAEIGASRLVTIVSGVEALARSLVVHHKAQPKNEIGTIYKKYRLEKPEELVKLILKFNGHSTPSNYYKEDTWVLFKYAVEFRNLIVHECTFLGQDKYPSLIAACEEVLDSLIKFENLVVK